jgi:hypothetical protein
MDVGVADGNAPPLVGSAPLGRAALRGIGVVGLLSLGIGRASHPGLGAIRLTLRDLAGAAISGTRAMRQERVEDWPNDASWRAAGSARSATCSTISRCRFVRMPAAL